MVTRMVEILWFPLLSALDAASLALLGKDIVDVTIKKTKKETGE